MQDVFSAGKVKQTQRMYRKFSANRIFDGYQWLEKDRVLITDQDGKIESITSVENAGDDIEALNGIVLPGLVNAHVHLELSHLKDLIPPNTGLVQFLMQVVAKRGNFSGEIIREAIRKADAEMWEQGIVAAGDICNTAETLAVKQNSSRITWRNFIEVISLRDENMNVVFDNARLLLNRFETANYQLTIPAGNSIVPHAPYSVNGSSFAELNQLTAGQTISIHSQECEAENDLFEYGTGDFLHLYKMLGYNRLPVEVTHRSSLQSYLPHFNQGQNIILVHNTATNKNDIEFLLQLERENNINAWFCLCPNANLYIENKLPDFRLIASSSIPFVIGTDSYASNYRLSIGDEIATLVKHFPDIDLSVFLKAATSDGAIALGVKDKSGQFKTGIAPGIVLMKEDFSTQRIL